VGATVALYPLLRAAVPGLAADVAHFYDLVPFSASALPAIVLVIVAEELLWRGLFFDGVPLGALPVPRATALAFAVGALAYGAGQLGPGEPVLAAVALFMGLLWAVEAVLTGALVASLVSHATWTLWVFGVAPLEARGGG
jgi:membrane protease YdiL (CAAX protease family)